MAWTLKNLTLNQSVELNLTGDIARIIKPQVNYKDKLIQRAQVDVSQN